MTQNTCKFDSHTYLNSSKHAIYTAKTHKEINLTSISKCTLQSVEKIPNLLMSHTRENVYVQHQESIMTLLLTHVYHCAVTYSSKPNYTITHSYLISYLFKKICNIISIIKQYFKIFDSHVISTVHIIITFF